MKTTKGRFTNNIENAIILVILGLIFLGIQGCVYGVVRDATTNSGVPEANVYAYASCSGNGCASHTSGPWVITTSSSSGAYIYDAYGYSVDPSEAMYIYPRTGQEAILLYLSKPGYRSQVLWHKPDYQSYTTEGTTYYYTVVQSVHLCANGSTDTDGDGICDQAEARYGTDPNNTDTDEDNLSDAAELFGFDGLDLQFYGADPLHKDIFLEIDYYPGLKPSDTAIDRVVAAFAEAPVSNPDGEIGINLHTIIDDQIAVADVDDDLNPAWDDFDVIKADYFESRRARAFHYVLFANQFNNTDYSGLSRGIPAHDFLVTLGNWSTPGGTVQQQAGTLMHELGHNLGLRHGGNENANYKPNYLSIMSYLYQLGGLTVDGASGVVDYSRLEVASVDEGAVNETAAFAPVGGSSTTEADLAQYGVRIRTCGSGRVWLTGNASVNLDFNRNGLIEGALPPEDLNGDCDTTDTFTNAINDWDNLIFDGGGTIGDSALGEEKAVFKLKVVPEEMEPCATENDA